MAKMANLYGTSVRNEIDLFAAWPIGTHLRLGDVGFLTRRGKLFERWGNLKDFGIAFGFQKAQNPTDFDFSCGKQIDIQFKAAGVAPHPGSMLTQADVGVSIEFGGSSSIVVVAHTTEETVTNLQQLEADLIALATGSPKKWKSDYVVITAAYESVGTTVILSTGRGSAVGITANAGVTVPFDLANAQIGLCASARCQKQMKALARPGFVPFIRVHHLVKGWRGGFRLSRYGS